MCLWQLSLLVAVKADWYTLSERSQNVLSAVHRTNVTPGNKH